MSSPHTLVDRDDSLLIVVDCQAGFLKKIEPQRRDIVLETMAFLVKVSTRLGIPSIVTVEEPHKHGGTAAELLASLAPGTVEHVKTSFSVTGDPTIKSALMAQPRRTAVLIGLETDVCVLQSALGLTQLGFRALVVADATASTTPEHAFGLDRARAFGIEIIRVKGLVYEWIRNTTMADALFGDGSLKPPASVVL
jgi:hypothetical protein